MSSAELASFEMPRVSAGERLAIATGAMAGRLADLLERALAEPAASASHDFLRVMAREAEQVAPWGLEAGDHPLDRLVGGLGLTPLELDLLILAGLPDEHEGYSAILRTLHPSGEPRPTIALAAQLFCADSHGRRALREVLASGAAVRSGIIQIKTDTPFFERSLLPGDSVWSALHGVDSWPASLTTVAVEAVHTGLEHWLATPSVLRARVAVMSGEARTILVSADTAEIAQQRAAAIVAAAGAEPVRIILPAGAGLEVERLLSVHAVARGKVPVVRIVSADGFTAPEIPAFLSHPGPIVVCGSFGGVLATGPRPVVEVRAERLSPTARRDLWRATVPELADQAAELGARYTIEPEAARAAADDARALARLESRPVSLDDLAQGVRTRSSLSLASGVRLIRPTARWEDLVLPEKRLSQLREAINRLLNQGRVLDEWGFLKDRPGSRGVRMLFAGGSGTGKTFSAEVMANALGVDLLLVDISRVVSKWIGETEKNLAEVFDVAERAQAVLLFDEADALFGKRTEVSDARDRYANMETAFLLTRLERFEGLAILSTNLRQNIDPAFMRRLEFVLDFEDPGPAERAALWEGHLPTDAPLAEDVDFRELASLYSVVGGFIRNATVAAGFLAAAEDSPIARTHIVRAIRREYEKSGRAFPGGPAGMNAP